MNNRHAASALEDPQVGWCRCSAMIILDVSVGGMDVIHWNPVTDEEYYECRDDKGRPTGYVAQTSIAIHRGAVPTGRHRAAVR